MVYNSRDGGTKVKVGGSTNKEKARMDNRLGSNCALEVKELQLQALMIIR